MVGPSPAPSGPSNQDDKASEIGGYGPAPDSALGAPAYALRVLKRQKELKELITELNDRLAKAEAERDGAEATLGQSALDYSLLPNLDEELKAKVTEAEKAITAAKRRSTKETERYQRSIERVDTELSSVRAELDPLVDREEALGDEIAEAETRHRRETAALQRAQIELRNLEQGKVQGDKAQQQARLQQLQGEIQTLEAQAAEAQRALQRTKQSAAQLEAQSAPLRKKLQTLEDQRQAANDEYEDALGLRSEEAKRAMAWRRSHLAVAGREVYDKETRPKLLDGARLFGRIEQSRAKVDALQSELELHLRALDAYDEDAYKMARYLALGAGGLLALVLLIVLLYGC